MRMAETSGNMNASDLRKNHFINVRDKKDIFPRLTVENGRGSRLWSLLLMQGPGQGLCLGGPRMAETVFRAVGVMGHVFTGRTHAILVSGWKENHGLKLSTSTAKLVRT